MTTLNVVYLGQKFQVGQQLHTLPDGSQKTRDVVLHPGSVVILPWVDARRICLIRNQRWTVGETLYELPAGTLDHGEDPQRAAARELHEETGYHGGRLTKLLEFYTSPGFLTERMHVYLAEELTPGPSHLEPEERIVTQLADWEEAMSLVAHRKIVDGKTLVTLLYYQWKRGLQH